MIRLEISPMRLPDRALEIHNGNYCMSVKPSNSSPKYYAAKKIMQVLHIYWRRGLCLGWWNFCNNRTFGKQPGHRRITRFNNFAAATSTRKFLPKHSYDCWFQNDVREYADKLQWRVEKSSDDQVTEKLLESKTMETCISAWHEVWERIILKSRWGCKRGSISC